MSGVPSWLPTVVPLVVLAALGVFLVARSRRAAASRHTAAAWPHTSGTVLSTSVQVRRTGNSRWEVPVVIYSYQVDGHPYQSYRVRVGDEIGRTRIAGDAQRTLARYAAGAAVTVFYDPTDPANAALER
jgi:Protein of unknown function (DUF3592)